MTIFKFGMIGILMLKCLDLFTINVSSRFVLNYLGKQKPFDFAFGHGPVAPSAYLLLRVSGFALTLPKIQLLVSLIFKALLDEVIDFC